MKTLTKILIITVVLVSIAFLWKEHFDLSQTIKSDKVSAYATAIAAILTAFTVYLLYKQNQQQIAELKASNLPDLYPTKATFETHDTKVRSVTSDFEYTYAQFFRIKEVNPEIKQSSRIVYISLHNIGLGAAKQIRIVWKYDRVEVEKLTNNIYQHVGNSYLEDTAEFDFVIANTKIEIPLPEFYMQCCGMQLNSDDSNFLKGNTGKPSLTLSISYLDIYNHKYQKEFIVGVAAILHHIDIIFSQTTLKTLSASG